MDTECIFYYLCNVLSQRDGFLQNRNSIYVIVIVQVHSIPFIQYQHRIHP